MSEPLTARGWPRERTEKLLAEAEALILEGESELEANPGNLSREVSLASLRRHADDLRGQLAEADGGPAIPGLAPYPAFWPSDAEEAAALREREKRDEMQEKARRG
jgi:hypothetical protein